jgi:hypothetical protein
MSQAIGGFATGFTQGYMGMKRLNMEQERSDREAQEFGLKKQRQELELEAAKRDEAFRKELSETVQPILQEFYQPQQAEPKNGLQGAQAPAPVMNLPAITRRFADASLAVGFKYGKVDLTQLKAARDLRKDLDDENMDEAVNTWLTTGDKSKVAEVFNKGGKMKFDPATMDIRTVEDPDGLIPANVQVFQKNPDGKEAVVFDYQKAALAGLSKEAYSRLVQEARKTKVTEQGDTFRTGMTTEASLRAAAMKNASEGRKLNPEVDAFNDRMNKEFEAVFKGPQFGLNPREESLIRGEISALGRQLIDAGMNGNQAYLVATQEVIKKNKIPVNISKIK